MLGYSREELLGMAVFDLDPGWSADYWFSEGWMRLKQAGSTTFETRAQRGDGSIIPVEVKADYVDFSGQEYLFAWTNDISERKRAEEELRQKDYIIESASSAIATSDLDGRMTYANPAFLETWGFEHPGEFLGESFTEYWMVADVFDGLMDALRNEGEWTSEIQARRRDGSLFDAQVSAAMVRDRRGNPVSFMSSSVDVSERKRAEEALRRQQALLESVYNGVDAAIFVVDVAPDGEFRYADHNVAHQRGIGLRTEEFRGKTPEELVPHIPSEVASAVRANYRRCLDAGSTIEYDESMRAGEHELWLSTRLVPLKDQQGRIYRIIGISFDITERRRAEQALERSERLHRGAVRAAGAVPYSRDYRTNTYEFPSPGMESLVGYPEAELVPTMWGSIVEEHILLGDLEGQSLTLAEAFDKADTEEGLTWRADYRIRTGDGGERWLADSAVYERDAQGRAIRSVGMLQDITERKRSEETLRQYGERLRILHEIDRDILEARSPEAIAYAALDGVRELVPSQRATIALYDVESNEAMVFAARANRETLLPPGTRVPTSSPTVEVLREGKVDLVEDLQAMPRLSDSHQALLQEGIRSHVHVPLMVRGELMGSLSLGSSEPGGFAREQIEIAQEVADQLAIALRQSHLYEQVQRHAEELEQRVADRTRELSALYEVATIASESLDLRTVTAQSLDRVMAAILADFGTIYLPDEGDGLLHVIAREGVPPGLTAQAEAQLGSVRQGLIGHVMERNEPIVVPDLATDPRAVLKTSPPLSGPFAGVPVRARGQTVGVLTVLRWREGPEFNDQEVALLSSIADQVGVVVDSARLRERAEQAVVLEERQRLARELHDSVTQSLYSVTLMAETGRRSAQGGDLETVSGYLGRLGEVARQALKEMRLLIYELRPPVLEQEGLAGALQQRLEAVEARAGVEARLLVEGEVELPAPVDGALYRIALEALNNALKHAAATSVTVRIAPGRETISLEVVDNGRGFDPAAARDGGGMGLTTMRDRAERLGGTLTILSAPGEGTRVRVSIGAGDDY